MFSRLLFAFVVLCLPVPASAQWKRATSDNFVVYSDGSETLLRQFTTKVEAFDALLRVVTGVKAPPAPRRLEIYLLRNAKAVSDLLSTRRTSIAGLYSPRLSGSIALVPRDKPGGKYDLDGESVLFHEYAHHFMMQYFPSAYPAWYVEGFAEFYSTAEMDGKGGASVGKPAYHRAYGLALLKPFPLTRLMSADPGAKTAEEVEAYYGRAWLLTHMLAFSPTRKNQIDDYLRAFASGVAPEKAAADAFGPLPQLEKELSAYMKGSMTYRWMSGLQINEAKISIETLDPAQTALMENWLVLRMGVDNKEKAGLIASIRKQAPRFPDSAFAMNLLVEALLLEERKSEAAELNDKLIALKPDFGPALLRKAETLADEAGAAVDPAAHWKSVRSLIARANRANNDDASALYDYYQSFIRQGVEPPKVAVDGLWRTYQLAPQVDEVRLALAQQLLNDGNKKSARNVLVPVAFDPHGGEGAALARQIIAEIDGEAVRDVPKPKQGGNDPG